MADVHRKEILLLRRGHSGGDIERGFRLSNARNIVALAFDREQGRVADRLRIDAPSAVPWKVSGDWLVSVTELASSRGIGSTDRLPYSPDSTAGP